MSIPARASMHEQAGRHVHPNDRHFNAFRIRHCHALNARRKGRIDGDVADVPHERLHCSDAVLRYADDLAGFVPNAKDTNPAVAIGEGSQFVGYGVSIRVHNPTAIQPHLLKLQKGIFA